MIVKASVQGKEMLLKAKSKRVGDEKLQVKTTNGKTTSEI